MKNYKQETSCMEKNLVKINTCGAHYVNVVNGQWSMVDVKTYRNYFPISNQNVFNIKMATKPFTNTLIPNGRM